MIKYQLYNQINSPLPISSSSLRSREGERGGECIKNIRISQIIIIYSQWSQ